jgi:hypothetical protein
MFTFHDFFDMFCQHVEFIKLWIHPGAKSAYAERRRWEPLL